MRLKMITAAAEEPITIDEVKYHCRVDNPEDEARLNSLILSARAECENYTNRIMVSSTWDLYLDEFPCEDYILLPTPLVSVTSVTYTDTNSVAQTMDSDDYIVDTVSEPSRLHLAYMATWPTSVLAQANVIQIRVVAGYTNAASVPQPLKDGMLTMVQAIFDGQPELIEIAQTMWGSYRWVPV